MAPDNTIRIPNAITVPTPALAHDVAFTAPDGTELFAPTLELVELHADERYGLAFTVVVTGDMRVRPAVGLDAVRDALARESGYTIRNGHAWAPCTVEPIVTDTPTFDRLAAERGFRL